jgi:hypothetical protein
MAFKLGIRALTTVPVDHTDDVLALRLSVNVTTLPGWALILETPMLLKADNTVVPDMNELVVEPISPFLKLYNSS